MSNLILAISKNFTLFFFTGIASLFPAWIVYSEWMELDYSYSSCWIFTAIYLSVIAFILRGKDFIDWIVGFFCLTFTTVVFFGSLSLWTPHSGKEWIDTITHHKHSKEWLWVERETCSMTGDKDYCKYFQHPKKHSIKPAVKHVPVVPKRFPYNSPEHILQCDRAQTPQEMRELRCARAGVDADGYIH